MKKNKIESISSIIMISLLVIMMLSSLFYSIFPKILIKFNVSNDDINSFFNIVDTNPGIDINYEKLYPFNNKNIKPSKKSFIDNYKKYIERFKEILENYTSKKLMSYESLIELSYIYNDIINFNLVSNSNDSARINLGNGYFSRINKKIDTTIIADRLIDFNNYLKNENTDLLYVQTPFKISKKTKISNIYKDYTNENMDNFLNKIKGKVNYIDLRNNIENDGLDNLDLFFKTDHHWLPSAGLYSVGEISYFLNEKYNMNLAIDNVNPNAYSCKTYPNMFLGTDGKSVSLKNADSEDFDLLSPKFKTKLNIKILDLKIDKTGKYDDTLLDKTQLKYENYYKISQYSTYGYGDRALIEIHNELINNKRKILVVKDSFADVMIPFMALETEYLSVIDLRQFNGSIKNYIEKYNPNIVLVIYNGSMLHDLSINQDEEVQNLWDFN